jgi:predicted transcriptional regulator of viral defense system
MVIDHQFLMQELAKYRSPKARLTRMIRNREIIQIRRGVFIYPNDTSISLKSLASVIYGPSYISFEYALSHYGLIPERSAVITCATYKKNKNRIYRTPLGEFHYHYLPEQVYPYDILHKDEFGQGYLIASPEKALCDTLYKIRDVTTLHELSVLLQDDLRLDTEMLHTLDITSITFLAPLYRKKNITTLVNLLETEYSNA